MSFDGRFEKRLQDLREKHLLRETFPLDSGQGSSIETPHGRLINFSSNDYLGFSSNETLKSAARDAVERWGTGAGSARLVAGDLPPHRALEEEVARRFSKERALLFNSGYQANVGILSSLAERDDVIFSDALCHASIVDGCRLSPAKKVVVPHANADALLYWMSITPCRGQRFFVTDGLFSVDGDRAPLKKQIEVAGQFEAMVIVDDAHGIGAVGNTGLGTVEEGDLLDGIDLLVGTFSKALGGFGAYATSSRAACALLRNRARSFIFSTSLPPSVAATGLAAIRLLDTEEGTLAREKLHGLNRRVREVLKGQGWELGRCRDQIFPLVIGSEHAALEVESRLRQAGFYVRALRPPTVPPGSCRLRLSLRADLEPEQVESLLKQTAMFVELRDVERG